MARKSDVPTKTISLTGDHVFMPTDLLTSGWEKASDTQRYPGKIESDDPEGKPARAKYEVHAELADFLIGRDQAIEVPADTTEG